MNPTQQAADMVKTWTEDQKNLWEGWLKNVQGLRTDQGAEVWGKTVQAWEESVKRTLDAQAEGTRNWVESLVAAPGVPKEAAAQSKQGQEMLQHWTTAQKQLWEGWFQIVKQFDPARGAETWATDGQKMVHTWQADMQKVMDNLTNTKSG